MDWGGLCPQDQERSRRERSGQGSHVEKKKESKENLPLSFGKKKAWQRKPESSAYGKAAVRAGVQGKAYVSPAGRAFSGGYLFRHLYKLGACLKAYLLEPLNGVNGKGLFHK
jgi:hypothetical protein